MAAILSRGDWVLIIKVWWHIYASMNCVIIGSGNVPHQAVIWNNTDILSNRPLATNVNGILIGYRTFYPGKCIWKYQLQNGSHFVYEPVLVVILGNFISIQKKRIINYFADDILDLYHIDGGITRIWSHEIRELELIYGWIRTKLLYIIVQNNVTWCNKTIVQRYDVSPGGRWWE